MKIKSSTKSLLVAIAEVLVIFGVCDLSNICMHYFMLKSDVYSLYCKRQIFLRIFHFPGFLYNCR